MSFLYNVIIGPIVALADWVFLFIVNKIPSLGVMGAVFGVSLVINFLALPLYKIADSLQDKERKIAKAMEYRVKRIKKAFKGDEQFMMLSEYYRQNHYHPLYVLRSSLSILIEIPFFIAAYQYLSHNDQLAGASWWIFDNLGEPDRLFSVNCFSSVIHINLLPIIMTAINFISGAIYTKNASSKEKIQLYAVALIFLVLLYESPSGLVLYWILNNIFSLVKNIVMERKNPGRIVHIVISFFFVLFDFYILSRHGSFVKKLIFTCFTALLLFYPVLRRFFLEKENTCFNKFANSLKENLHLNFPLFIFSAMSLAVLAGIILPASTIASSPIEFSFLGSGGGYSDNPVTYIWSTFFLFTGFFVFWPVAVYKMFDCKVRKILPSAFFILLFAVLANVFIFKYDYGNLSITFTLEDDKVLDNSSPFFSIIPFVVLSLPIFVLYAANKFNKKQVLSFFVFSILIGETFLGFIKIKDIDSQFRQFAQDRVKNEEKFELANGDSDGIEKIYHLSKTQPNVIVLFFDRAISCFFEKAVNEDAELKKQFDGCVFYPNALTLGSPTALGTPGMMGGYEYSPLKMNERSDTLLRIKHNEAMLMLPKIFTDAGFSATITDPPWSNYKHEGDYSPFEKYPEMKALATFGKYTNKYFSRLNISDGVFEDKADVVCRKEIKNFCVIQTLYPPLRSMFYSLCIDQNRHNDRDFYDSFSSLYFLPEQTDFASEKPSYCFIDNETTHEPRIMAENFLQLKNESGTAGQAGYDVNFATFKQVGKFFDWLRENGVYDNTRVILVSDHGGDIGSEFFADLQKKGIPIAGFNCLLVYKDFNSNDELKTDNTFMTNADTLFLAKKDLDVSDVNPFTGRNFVQDKENGVPVYSSYKKEGHANSLVTKTRFTLKDSLGWFVKDNIFDSKNWIPLEEYKSSTDGGKK